MKLGITDLFALADIQARMSLKAEASKLLLSYLWWIIEPALFVAMFYFVFEVLMKTGRADFLPFLICGKIPYAWFSKTVTLASGSISQNEKLIAQIDIPKTLFPLASIQQSLYKEAVVGLVVIVALILLGHPPTLLWFWLVPLIFVQYVMTAVASFIGAICVARLQDFRIAINLLMLFLLFVSGIFWDVNSIASPPLREAVLGLNPLAFLIDCYRKIILHHQMFDLGHLAALGGVLMALMGIVLLAMQRKSRTIAAWVLNS